MSLIFPMFFRKIVATLILTAFFFSDARVQGADINAIAALEFWQKNRIKPQKILFQLPGKLAVSEVVYGHKSTGFRRTKNFELVGGKLQLSLMPTSYQLPTEVYASTPQGQIYLGERQFENPWRALDRIFIKDLKTALPGEMFVVGSIPYSKLAYTKPDRYRRNILFVSMINRLGETIWAHFPKFLDSFPTSKFSLFQLPDGDLMLLDGKGFKMLRVTLNGVTKKVFDLKEKLYPFNLVYDWRFDDGRMLFITGRSAKVNPWDLAPLRISWLDRLVLLQADFENLANYRSRYKIIYDNNTGPRTGMAMRRSHSSNTGAIPKSRYFQPTLESLGQSSLLLTDPRNRKIIKINTEGHTEIPIESAVISAMINGKKMATLGLENDALVLKVIATDKSENVEICKKVITKKNQNRLFTGRIIYFGKDGLLLHIKWGKGAAIVPLIEPDRIVQVRGCNVSPETILSLQHYFYSPASHIQLVKKMWDTSQK